MGCSLRNRCSSSAKARAEAIAADRVFFQAAETNRFQVDRNMIVQPSRTGWLVIQDLVNQHAGVATKRQLTGQHLEHDHAQRIDIRAGTGQMRLPHRLFRRHIGRRTQDLPFDRHRDFAHITFGQAKVHDVRLQRRIDHDIARFQIAVDNPRVMRMIERLGN